MYSRQSQQNKGSCTQYSWKKYKATMLLCCSKNSHAGAFKSISAREQRKSECCLQISLLKIGQSVGP